MEDYHQVAEEALIDAINSLPTDGVEGEHKTITLLATHWFTSELATSNKPMTLNDQETATNFDAVFFNGQWKLKGAIKVK